MSDNQIEYVLYALVFIGVLLFIEGSYFLIVGRGAGAEAVNRRMKMLASGRRTKDVLETLRRGNENTAGPYASVPGLAVLDSLVSQSGSSASMGFVIGVIMALGAGICIALLIFVPLLPFYLVPFVGLPASIALLVYYFSFKKKRRIKRLSQQLPDALDLMVRSLRAGHPMTSSLGLVAREMRDPMGTEIGIVVDEMTYGLDFRAALENLRQRIPAPDLHYLVVTINIQHGTGGNLAEVLGNLSMVIRSRYQMFAKIRALSAEGRISATILSVIPFFVMAAVWLTTPGYYVAVLGDPALPVIAGIAGGMEITAIAVMWKMVNFKF